MRSLNYAANGAQPVRAKVFAYVVSAAPSHGSTRGRYYSVVVLCSISSVAPGADFPHPGDDRLDVGCLRMCAPSTIGRELHRNDWERPVRCHTGGAVLPRAEVIVLRTLTSALNALGQYPAPVAWQAMDRFGSSWYLCCESDLLRRELPLYRQHAPRRHCSKPATRPIYTIRSWRAWA